MQAGIGLSGVVAVWLANLILPRLFPIIQPDSYSYLDFRAIRTSFYPLFLRHVHDGAEDYQTVLTVQVAFHAVAFGVLLLGLARARLPLSALILLLVATALNPFLQSFHHTVLTESLAFSLTFLASGAFCLFVSERRKVFLALTTLFASMATALKLSALPLLIGLIMASVLVMMLRRPRHRKQTFSWVALLLPVVIVLVCENRAFFDVHEHREGVLERHLFGKAVLIQAITPASSLPLGYENLEPVLLDYRNQAQPVLSRLYAERRWCQWLWAHTYFEAGAYYRFAEPELAELETRLSLS